MGVAVKEPSTRLHDTVMSRYHAWKTILWLLTRATCRQGRHDIVSSLLSTLYSLLSTDAATTSPHSRRD
jgi:hypothetical protein